MKENYHTPVMLREVMDSLNLTPGCVCIDGTVGGGGHAEEILKRNAPEGVLIGIDRDDDALEQCRRRLSVFGGRAILVKGNFADMRSIASGLGFNAVDSILVDLGVSSYQLDEAGRGFSFSQDAPLDMRMDRRGYLTARHIVNDYSEAELVNILKRYGEEPKAARIARTIVFRRRNAPIETTKELASLVSGAISGYSKRSRIHPATRTFQALRIAVNDELGSLERGLEEGIELLHEGGRYSVISFHSLEDRMVKNLFRDWEKGCICPPDFPLCVCGRKGKVRVVNRKPVVAGEDETQMNPRARSAKLRTAERV